MFLAFLLRVLILGYNYAFICVTVILIVAPQLDCEFHEVRIHLFLLSTAFLGPSTTLMGSSLTHDLAGRQAMYPEQAWPYPALTETPTEGLELLKKSQIQPPKASSST